MTQVTPPGWYPDPGQTSDGPATERWWDGKAWTDRTRPAGSAAGWGPPAGPSPAADAQQAQPTYPAYPGGPAAPGYPGHQAYPGHPGYPGYPVQPPGGRRRALRIGTAVVVAVAVLASIGIGVYALTSDNGAGASRADSQQQGPDGQDGGQDGPFGDSGGPGGQSPAPEGSRAPEVEGGGTLSDPVNGISLPVPEGWTGQAFGVGAQMTSDDSYKCPGDTSKSCTKGGAYSAPAQVLGTEGSTPEEVAKADIAENAEEAYGGNTYGKITSHQVLASKAVTVAGQKGYLVRWKAITSKGADGLVESLVFPSPADSGQLVVVRFGIDADQKASVIDEITEGIKASSGGDGHSV
ncbi:DUF2510 domain-containing protein [Streptomyces chromofuscus]|uniref:DUF2510 domain-containing protein n=1 Tax=Streptomyces chromofuscus TaxID=42881 RepID=A0A7M2T626_STRCW|nr:DUF2510 domain-containing protein [Streptomyces chromofuscus]QOV44106.1 DUF2510 domain-containing protein [Streptomyces chromofuscus]GGT05599.1 hypothetical protein GCM10010254_27420 [Streptomyces chromofuscus]